MEGGLVRCRPSDRCWTSQVTWHARDDASVLETAVWALVRVSVCECVHVGAHVDMVCVRAQRVWIPVACVRISIKGCTYTRAVRADRVWGRVPIRLLPARLSSLQCMVHKAKRWFSSEAAPSETSSHPGHALPRSSSIARIRTHMTSPEGAHTTPCHGAVQGSPDSQLPLLVHPGPPVAWYRSVSAAAWLGGVAPVATWLPSRAVAMAAPNAAAVLPAADDQQSAPRGRRRPVVAVMPLVVVLGEL